MEDGRGKGPRRDQRWRFTQPRRVFSVYLFLLLASWGKIKRNSERRAVKRKAILSFSVKIRGVLKCVFCFQFLFIVKKSKLNCKMNKSLYNREEDILRF